MHIICPHCHNPIEVIPLTPREEITCPSCGSSFHLDAGETTGSGSGAGQKIGKFTLIETLGQGAFGTVYKARDAELDRTVAIKVPRAGNLAGPQELDRFLREARSVAQLRHPSIVSVHEVGQQDGLPYLVSDFVQGITLADLTSARRPGFRDAAELVAAVADALQYAHEQGVVHRDVKPSNIMIGDGGKPCVMDFGLAKREAGEITMTIEGQVLGTPAYMPPEQARGEGHAVDARGDVYSLGVVLYQLLTGELPFRGTQRMLLHQVLHDEPRPLRRLNDAIPRDLETICLKCLHKEPGKRYESAAALAADLRRFLNGEPIVARPVGRLERAAKWVRRNPLLAGAVAAMAAALLLGTGFSTYFGITASREANRGRERVWQALFDQARAERLAGNRERSLEALREAMQIKITPELREQAVQTILSPGIQPLEEVPSDATFVPENHYHEGKVPPELPAAPRDAHCPAISADRGTAVLEQEDRDRQATSLTVWDLKTGRQVSRLGAVPGRLFDCCLSQDGRLFAYALYAWDAHPQFSADDKVRIIDTRTGKVQAEVSRATPEGLPGWNRSANSLAFNPDGSLLAGELTGGATSAWCVRVWDVATGVTVGTMPPACMLVPGAWSKDGRVLRIAPSRGAWSDDPLPAPAWVVFGPPSTHRVARSVETLSFHPDGTRLAGNASVWNVVGERGRLWLHPSPQELPGAFAVFDTAGRLWTWSEPQRGKNKNTGKHQDITVREVGDTIQTRLTWGSDDSEQDSLAFSQDGRRLLTFRKEWPQRIFGIELWDPTAGRKVADWEGASELRAICGSPTFSPDGDLVACSVGYDDGRQNLSALFIWQVSSGQVQSRLDIGPVFKGLNFFSSFVGPAVFSPDGRRLFVALMGGVAVCDVGSEAWQGFWLIRRGPEPTRHEKLVTALAGSSDGRLVAAGDEGGRVCLWETRTGRELACWETHEGKVTALAFSPDGHALASGSSQGVVKLWDLPRIREGLTRLGFDWPE